MPSDSSALSSPTRRGLISRYPALGFANYRRYWLASFASVGATQLMILAQGWLVYELSSSALYLGYLGAAAALPNLLLTLIGGVIADRFNKRTLMLCTSALTGLLLVLLAWLDYAGVVQVWHVLAIAAAISLVTGIEWPVRVAIFPQLVTRPAFASAVALNSFTWQVTRMAMPAIGGVILAASDTWLLFALGAAGFAAMFITMWQIPIANTEHEPTSGWQQLSAGIGYIWHTPLFRTLIGLTFAGMFLANAFVQILPVFAELLGAREVGYGLLLSAGGLGSIVGTLAIGALHGLQKPGWAMLGGSIASSISLILFGLAAKFGWFYPALFLVFLASACASVFMVASMTILQLAVPERLRGRVMGVHSMCYSLIPLGGLFLGWLSVVTAAPTAIMLSNAALIAVMLIFGAGSAVVRELDQAALSGHD